MQTRKIVFAREHLLVTVCGAVLLLLSGCASSEEVKEPKSTGSLSEHEERFDPTVYRDRLPADSAHTERPSQPTEPEPVRWTERKETVMGYRIQLHSTTDIDEAQRVLPRYAARIDSIGVSSGRLDMSFDAPYYKIRMGDFLTKPPADSLRLVLQTGGLTEAWVVRDRIQRVIRTKE